LFGVAKRLRVHTIMDRKRLQEAFATIVAAKWRFFTFFLITFFITLFALALVGFVPESIDGTARGDVSAGVDVPTYIEIPSVGVSVSVVNPESTDIGILDNALTRGVVHYPGSGLLNENANVFLFGHSSFLPNVINKNYQAFNGLKRLKGGEEILVRSANREYVYRVTSVTLSDAGEIRVDFDRGVKKLTLSTCNSFGAKDERYVVEAEFVESHSLES
jgi:LPXTG-site transpeptidase (sortase) family protein